MCIDIPSLIVKTASGGQVTQDITAIRARDVTILY